jgi:hypothetical protein
VKKLLEITIRNPDISQIKKKTCCSKFPLLHIATVSASPFDCCSTPVDFDCKPPFSNQNVWLQQKTPSQNCDCLRLWQFHSNSATFDHLHYVFITCGAVTELIITSVFFRALEIWGLFQNQEILFWIEKTCSALSCNYWDVSRYVIQTHLPTLIRNLLICFPMQYKTCYFCQTLFTS